MQISQAIPSAASTVQGHRHHGGASPGGLQSGLLGAIGSFPSGLPSGIQGTPVLPPVVGSAGSAGAASSAGPAASSNTLSALLSTQEQGSSQGQGSLATNLASLDKLLGDATKSGSATAPVVSAVA